MLRARFTGVVGTIIAGIAVPALAQSTASAHRIDGTFSDLAWEGAAVVRGFVQRDPREGAPATLATEVRIVYDTANVYVAVRAFDPEPSRLVGFLTRRDARTSSDWIRVLIDSYHDRRTAYEFAVNPAGVKQDVYWYNDATSDDSWDAIWDVVVSQDTEGWRAEFRIPFSQLRFSAAEDAPLGFAVVREVARLNEISTWPLLPRSASGWVSSFGELTGVTVPGSVKRLELVPYTLAQVVTEREAGNPLQNTVDPGASFGLDVKYALTPSLTVNATLNPDFGQVEADPAVVNLSAFETFFVERRPFFVEGSGNYRFDINCYDGPQCTGLFYSRRIGREPRGEPDVDEDAGGYFIQPLQSTILGASKLTGRVGKFSIGALTAATQEERARVARGPARSVQIVEPFTLYSLARARREFADQSSLGFMLTSTNRKIVNDISFLPDSAVTGGVDYDWRLGQRWSLDGHWAGSSVRGSTEAITELQEDNVHSFQRPDAAHVEFDPTSRLLNGHAGLLRFNKIAGERIRLNTSVAYRSPGFEINDLGFLRRADEIPQFSWIQFRFNTPGRYIRSYVLNFNQYSNHNFDGDRLGLGGNVNMHWAFQNLWNTGFGINLNGRAFDDRLTRGGPGGYRNSNAGWWQYFDTNDRRPVSFHWFSFVNNDSNGSRVFELVPRVAVRPASALSAEIGFRWNANKDDAQWIDKVEREGEVDRYLFGRLDQTTVAITTRLNYTITPNLSLQLYGEPFVSAGDYEHYKELVAGRALRHADRYAPFAHTEDEDFSVLSFRTTNVLRWEFKPGSTFFVVWQQSREGDGAAGSFRFGRDFRGVFSTGATNTLLVKFAYWVNR